MIVQSISEEDTIIVKDYRYDYEQLCQLFDSIFAILTSSYA